MDSIKYFVLFMCLCSFTYGQNKEKIADIKEKMMGLMKHCIAEAGASAHDEAAMIGHNTPNSHEGKCAIFCMHKMTGTQDEAGHILKDGIMSMLSSDQVKEAFGEEWSSIALKTVKTCEPKVHEDADPCITAASMMDCFMTEGKSAGLSSMEELN